MILDSALPPTHHSIFVSSFTETPKKAELKNKNKLGIFPPPAVSQRLILYTVSVTTHIIKLPVCLCGESPVFPAGEKHHSVIITVLHADHPADTGLRLRAEVD